MKDSDVRGKRSLMCTSCQHDANWREIYLLPKVELHLHLEGMLRVKTVTEMAVQHEPKSPLAQVGWNDWYWTYRDLTGFVDQLSTLVRVCLKAPEDYARAATECFEDLGAENVRYAEVSIGARIPGQPQHIPIDEVLTAVDAARQQVESQTGLHVGLIVGISRDRLSALGFNHAAASAVTIVREVLKARDQGVAVVGIDLHGDEQRAPDVTPFVSAFRLAREAGLGLRAHAGEASGPESIRAALDILNVSRIAHGVRAIEDSALVSRLARDGVPLDICPTSNRLTGATPPGSRHPIRRLFDAGVRVNIGSDDPIAFGTTVGRELAELEHEGSFSRAELRALTLNAVAAAFLPPADQAALAIQVAEEWPVAEGF